MQAAIRKQIVGTCTANTDDTACAVPGPPLGISNETP